MRATLSLRVRRGLAALVLIFCNVAVFSVSGGVAEATGPTCTPHYLCIWENANWGGHTLAIHGDNGSWAQCCTFTGGTFDNIVSSVYNDEPSRSGVNLYVGYNEVGVSLCLASGYQVANLQSYAGYNDAISSNKWDPTCHS